MKNIQTTLMFLPAVLLLALITLYYLGAGSTILMLLYVISLFICYANIILFVFLKLFKTGVYNMLLAVNIFVVLFFWADPMDIMNYVTE